MKEDMLELADSAVRQLDFPLNEVKKMIEQQNELRTIDESSMYRLAKIEHNLSEVIDILENIILENS